MKGPDLPERDALSENVHYHKCIIESIKHSQYGQLMDHAKKK